MGKTLVGPIPPLPRRRMGRAAARRPALFEMLILEGAQAGLSWDTILNKRENYRAAFDGFTPRRVSAIPEPKIESLLRFGIVRNRLKFGAAVTNARLFLDIQKEFGTFDAYIWQLSAAHPFRTHGRA